MFLIRLAFKNLTRHRRRTLITAAVIAAAIFVFLFLDSLLLGLNNASYKNIIDYSSSHIQIYNREYWMEKDELPLTNLLGNSGEIISVSENIEGVRGISKKLAFKARLNNGIDELPIQGIGVNSEEISKNLKLKNKIIKGSFFTKNEEKAVLGKRLADLMEVETGDFITLLVRTKEDTFNTIELEIGGLLETPNPDVNQNNVYIPLSTAQQALNVEGQVSQLLVRIDNERNSEDIAALITKRVGENKIKTQPWNQLTAVSILGAKQGANQAILGIILLIAALGIINTVILSALERMEEIGMMKALGLKKGEIVFTFVLESTGVGIIGGIMGCLFGIFSISLFSKIGIDFAELYNMDMGSFGIPIVDKIYGAWNPEAFIFVFVFSIIISLLSSVFPAYWAAKKDPVQAIHHR